MNLEGSGPFRLAGPARRRFRLAVVLGAGAASAGVGLLATSAWLIARAAERPGAAALGVAIAGVQFFALARAFGRYGERLAAHDAAFRALAALRIALYRCLVPLAPAGLPAFRDGDLLARLVRDTDAQQELLLRVIAPCAVALVAGAAAVVLLWVLAPAAGLVLLIALVVAASVLPWRARAAEAGVHGELSATIVDLVHGGPELLVNGALPDRLRRAQELDARVRHVALTGARTTGRGRGLVTLALGLALCSALVAGIDGVADGRLDRVLLPVVVLVPLAALELVIGLPDAAQRLAAVRGSTRRVREPFEATAPVAEAPLPAPVPEGRHLQVRGLRARYGPALPWALDGIDLDLAPGRRVAVVGPSGAGKSTLAAVLLRFLDHEGSVTLGGAPVRELDGDAYRRVVGLVAQDAHVFDTTLRENLLLANRVASAADLRRALGHARLAAWADRLPDGLDTECGPGGRRLSGGQRRRLALARAELARFPLLVLDEPAEHLDPATADAIVADALAGERGILLITHRLTGLEAMDEIVVLDGGRVVERGTHAELLARGGGYAESCALTRARNTW
jgi:thiol reductant ABC exporter CydC subunit